METCRFYGPVLKTFQGLHCGAAGEENLRCRVCVVDPLLLREQWVPTHLTIWTVVQRPFWPICPGRRGLSGGGPTSLGGYSSAHSSHSPLKCWTRAGERQARRVLQMVGPPPWALPLLSPSGTGHLCCSLQQMIKQEDNYWLDSRHLTFTHDFRVKMLLYSQSGDYCGHFEDVYKWPRTE